jgi:uncharacterized membrane protein
MTEAFFTFLGIYFLCWFKFIAGPVLASAAGYSVLETVLVTVAGMMSSVTVFSVLGIRFKKFLALRRKIPKPKFSSKNRKIVSIWGKYGKVGIAFLTPIFLTPLGGTLLLISFGTQKRQIFIHMLWSSILWAIVFSFSIDLILSIPFFERLLG